MHYEVCDCPVDSVTGVASRRDYPTLIQASKALLTRLSDECQDRYAEQHGVNEVVLPDPEFAAAVGAAVDALVANLCADVTYRGSRYWIEAHEARDGGFREST